MCERCVDVTAQHLHFARRSLFKLAAGVAAAPILKSFVDDRNIRIVGGIYELKSGRLELLS